ncbi:MAG: hydantoinase B/oxoprolinase family protein [Gammaproteobacteria bacterium]|nr:hydantoinase B/oxoprolinase family protein [Gammaproteobacteria bacterium]
MNAISLSIFANRIDAICEEMGVTLQKAAFSPNIRDRLDYSCAVFDVNGELCAQAAHIPVHLGSMAFAMSGIVQSISWQAGDMVVVNDPFMGGTHLPDVTLIMPVFIEHDLHGFVVNRAHHADIGAETPGSMPLSSCLQEEGQIIPPTKLIKAGVINEEQWNALISTMRNATESAGDFNAQIAANRRGHDRLINLIQTMGVVDYLAALCSLNDYAEQLALSSFCEIPDGEYRFSDVLDDDGLGHEGIEIKTLIKIEHGKVSLDFAGTASQVKGNVNCPLSVTAAAVYYVFRCLLPAQTPACAGSFRPIKIQAPAACLLNAEYPSAVAAGNVETSTRIVDVVLGALAQAIPEKIPAASHGSMNNLAMGYVGDEQQSAWDYYETIGGGMGASVFSDGQDAVQTHMTNTLNTPIESLEMNYPLRVNRYQIRRGSGGEGKQCGGDGLIREFEFLAPTEVTVLSERRQHAPWGLAGADDGQTGLNHSGQTKLLGKFHQHFDEGDLLIIETPGGGGYQSIAE